MEVWCLLVDHESRPVAGQPIKVQVPSETDVADLKKMVKDEASPHLNNTAAFELEVWRFTNSTADFVDNDMLEELYLVVKILKTESVSTLKDLIKEKQSPRLNHVAALELNLSRVSLPVDGDLEERLKTPISHHWGSPYHSRKCSPTSKRITCISSFKHQLMGLGTNDAREQERRDQIPALRERFQNVILTALAPADSAKLSNYTKSQIPYSIYDSRYKADKPRTSVAPPVQLFHPAFGHFLDDMEKRDAPLDNIIPETSTCKRFRMMTKRLLTVMELETHGSPFMILQEDKNEFGDGGSDPAGLSVGHCWAQPRYAMLRNATACPTFLVATNSELRLPEPYFPSVTFSLPTPKRLSHLRLGHHLRSDSGTFRVRPQPRHLPDEYTTPMSLTPDLRSGIPLASPSPEPPVLAPTSDFDPTSAYTHCIDSVLNELHITCIVRAFNALQASLKKLGSYYEGLDTGNLPDDLHYFPSIAAYPVGDGRTNFKYVGFLENVISIQSRPPLRAPGTPNSDFRSPTPPPSPSPCRLPRGYPTSGSDTTFDEYATPMLPTPDLRSGILFASPSPEPPVLAPTSDFDPTSAYTHCIG
ncbi:uncharacterized protein EI90DRAFT_3125565 [Cantharellus anzutake]|uniref:uncharacterized protein n=1 Tax=Cantharellus anzutake TaxID=1750568 RepID=UPI0019080BBF|nr:uncharacterized protein EI90DRAFT_3125565 [Cantharellus anzutake]KAF8328811.1 hypothetical protein EI90DRAFT_3125565 [Cantharellus anzutake]